jgi:hypothetical protein
MDRPAAKPRATFADRVATLEERIERVTAMVAELGEFAAEVATELDLRRRDM